MATRRPDCCHGKRSRPQHPPVKRCLSRGVVASIVAAAGMAALDVSAQETAARPGLSVVPSLDIQETLTDNVGLTSTGRRWDLITQVSPGVRMSSTAGRVRGSLDYSLTGVMYARRSSSDNLQQSLSAAGTAEAIDHWAYVDASASISQQYISALGTQSTDRAQVDANRTEVASAQLSPYVRGRLGGFATYEARATWATTRSKGSNADSRSSGTLLRIASDTSTFARLGWSADWSRQVVDFSATGSNDIESLTGALTFAATNDLSLTARAGREVNNLLTLDKTGYRTWGWGASWKPTDRTQLDVTRDQRFFGTSHSVRFEHRMPRSVWTFSDTQNISTNASSGGSTTPQTVYDLLFAQFASIAPDPVQRAALVDTFLQNNGLTRTTLASGGFLTSTVSVQRSQTFSVAMLGVRSTVLVSTFRSDARAVNPTAAFAGDLSNGNTLHTIGFGVNVSHRLTPLSALSAGLTRTQTSASLGGQSTDLRSLTATWTNRLRESADFSLSARRTLFGSATNPYAEDAVIANLMLRF